MNCLADLSLREFTPDLTKDVRNPYCLAYIEAADTHPGFSEADCKAYLICNNPQTVSERVITAKDEAWPLRALVLIVPVTPPQLRRDPHCLQNAGAPISRSSGA